MLTVKNNSNQKELSSKPFSLHLFIHTFRMSDSESEENLSDLEEQQGASENESDAEEEEKPELKGILNDVEETEVSWKDLVSL